MRSNRFTLLVENQEPRTGSSLVDGTNKGLLRASHGGDSKNNNDFGRNAFLTVEAEVGAKMECPGVILERGNARLIKSAGSVTSMWQSPSLDTASYDLPSILSTLRQDRVCR